MGLTVLRPNVAKKEARDKKKFEKKLGFYAKVKETVASLAAKKAIKKDKRVRSRQKKLKAYDLSTLSEFLPELNSSPKITPRLKTKLDSKSKKKMVEKESENLRAVINNPVFLLDPLSAIRQHLENTQPPSLRNEENRLLKNRKTNSKRKRTKSSGGQAMEM